MNQDNTQNKPVSSVGTLGINKERELSRQQDLPVKELNIEQELSKEIKEAGVVVKSETIEIPPDLKQLGVQPIGSTTPVPLQPTITLPITDEQIKKGAKANIFSSLRWLATWCLFILKRCHLTLKVIHGKVTRVKQ